ncbi:MAG TPA: hypothetical protein VGK84_10260 [Candidatus Tumulicola sp.]|jgi:hypothetical protein
MQWFARIAIGYVVFMLLAVAAIQYFASANRELASELRSPTGEYTLRVYRSTRVPTIFGGRGPAPGVVEVSDSDGHVFDSEHVPDVDAVGGFQWERYKVEFRYADGVKTFETALALAQ